MAGKSKSWTPERRAAQSARMKERKIWQHSTGPKTDAGKAAVAQNAMKHGYRSAEFKALCTALSAQAKFVREVDVKPVRT